MTPRILSVFLASALALAACDEAKTPADTARADAQALAGGGPLPPAPPAVDAAAQGADGGPLVKAVRALASGPGGANCLAQVAPGPSWTERLPDAFPIYPRAEVVEAGGTDAAGCALRVVSFVTPVAPNDVLAFYAARARQAGYGTDHVRDGGESTLSGLRGRAGYVVYVNAAAGGGSAVELVTGGS